MASLGNDSLTHAITSRYHVYSPCNVGDGTII
jgi:hypothetical protein